MKRLIKLINKKVWRIAVCSTLLLHLLVTCGAQNDQAQLDKTTNPFFAYNFGGLEQLSPKEQIDLLQQYGYQGIALRMATAENVAQLPEFIRIANQTEGFDIFSVFIRYNFNAPEVDRDRWKKVVELIANSNTALWVIFGRYDNKVRAVEVENTLKNMVLYSADRNVRVTLYPHHNCYFYSAEQALPMVKKINHPNLSLALHTCHELKDGGGYRLPAIVDSVKNYISFVTIAGADRTPDKRSARTLDKSTIQPLEDSDFDFGPFLKALKEAKYKGPVGLINFGFDKSPEEYLPKSLATWKKLKNKYLNY